MQYRLVKSTGWKISELSFGCMRFHDDETAAAAVRKAIELGVNYFDVAPGYGSGTAEPRLGMGLKGLRDKVIVTAKSSPGNGGDGVGETYSPETGFGIRTADQARKQIERSMEILGVDHLDMYHLWACHGDPVFEEAMKPGGFLEGVRKAQEEGLFDYLGITTHMDADGIIRYLSRFDFDMVTIPFYVMDISRVKAVEYCAERGIGVVAMNPLAGGRLVRPSSVLKRIATDQGFESMSEAALRYLTSYQGVTTVLNGITYPEQVVDSVGAVEKGQISQKAAKRLQDRLIELYTNVKHFCTGCGYCGHCPEGILIPQVLETYTNMLVPSLAEAAINELAEKLSVDGAGMDPSKCVECRICESKCPNKLPVTKMMAAANEKWSTQ